MYIIISETSIINMDKFENMTLNTINKTIKIKTHKGFLGLFPTYKDQIDTYYSLKINYIRDKQSFTFTNEGPDFNYLKKVAISVISQLKSLDANLINQEFENVFLKEE